MKELKKKYSFSNADLAMLASNMVVFMNRDVTNFAVRGVDAQAITSFASLGTTFELFPPDEYYLALVTEKVVSKNVARNNAIAMVQRISGFFEQKWGLGDFHYKQLRIKGIHIMSDNNFLVTCRNVATVASDYLTELTAIGLTQADIDDLTAEAQIFEEMLNSIIKKIAERDEKTQERTEKGNELYSYIKKYSMIGKLIWQNVDEAKYNDYVIYHTTIHLPGKVLGMAYDLATNTCSWDDSPHAEGYQLQRMLDSAPDWTVVYEGAAPSVVDVPPAAGSWLYRCRGQNLNGSGEWSNVLTVLIPV